VWKSKQKAVVVDATGQKTTVGGVKGAKKQSKMQTQFIVNHLPGSTRRKAEAKWQWHISKLERRKEDLVGRLAEICRLQQEQTGGGKEGGEDGGNVGFGGVGTSEGGLDMVGVGKKSRKAERRQKRLDVEEEAKGKSRSKANKGKGNERKMNGAGAQGHGLMKQKKKKLKARGKEAPAAAALDWPTEDSESTTESVGGNGQGSEGASTKKKLKQKLSARQHREIGEREEYLWQLQQVEEALSQAKALDYNDAIVAYAGGY
jgi:hypothetical protein